MFLAEKMSLFGLLVGVFEKKTGGTGVWTSFSRDGLVYGRGAVGDDGDSGRYVSPQPAGLQSRARGAAASDREHAWRGVGKSFFALGIALAVAMGGSFLRFQAPRRRPSRLNQLQPYIVPYPASASASDPARLRASRSRRATRTSSNPDVQPSQTTT